MSQTFIITLLLFVFVLPILGAAALRLLGPRLAPAQLYSAAVLLMVVVITSVLVLARGDIPSLQIGNLSILLPVTAPDDAFLPLVPTTAVDQSPVSAALSTSAPGTTTAVLTVTVVPLDTSTAVPPTPAATATATAAPTIASTATPEPTVVPPTPIPPPAAPAPPAAQRKYTVQPGDTLLSIARQFNTTVTAIVEANKLTPQQADALRVGQELVIP